MIPILRAWEKGSFVSKIVLWLLLITLINCDPPSNADRAKLKELQVKYGDRYTFSLDCLDALYLYARLKPGASIRQGEDEEIYKMFMFVDFAKEERRNTHFYLLNFYDAKSNFMYQLGYSHRTHTFSRGHTEYH